MARIIGFLQVRMNVLQHSDSILLIFILQLLQDHFFIIYYPFSLLVIIFMHYQPDFFIFIAYILIFVCSTAITSTLTPFFVSTFIIVTILVLPLLFS